MYDTLPELIASLGFPIAVCIYLLWERRTVTKCLEKAIKNDLCCAINDLKTEIVILSERLK